MSTESFVNYYMDIKLKTFPIPAIVVWYSNVDPSMRVFKTKYDSMKMADLQAQYGQGFFIKDIEDLLEKLYLQEDFQIPLPSPIDIINTAAHDLYKVRNMSQAMSLIDPKKWVREFNIGIK